MSLYNEYLQDKQIMSQKLGSHHGIASAHTFLKKLSSALLTDYPKYKPKKPETTPPPKKPNVLK